MKKTLFIALAFLFLPVLFSCARKAVDTDLSKIETSEVIKRVRASEEKIKSVRGLAYIRIETPDEAIAFRQVTVAEEPNLFRLEALDPLGRTVGMITSDGEKIYLIFPEETRVFDSLHQFDLSSIYPAFPVRIGADDLVNFLLGRPPVKTDYEDDKIYMSTAANKLVLHVFGKEGEQESLLQINPLTYVIEEARVNLDGGSATASFSNFAETESGSLFPRRLELRFSDSVISVKYDDRVKVNREVDRNLYKPLEPIAKFEK
ncbi:MAG TPA: hypothetical protein VLB01_04220 [Thermodesulfobacteriota bacterium]|nr:hypothetical protein [Thermodesulfobacteriota bacterium]